MSKLPAVPSVSVTYAQNGRSTQPNELGMRPMQEQAYQQRGEPYLKQLDIGYYYDVPRKLYREIR